MPGEHDFQQGNERIEHTILEVKGARLAVTTAPKLSEGEGKLTEHEKC